jgi:predicted aspartyl protease
MAALPGLGLVGLGAASAHAQQVAAQQSGAAHAAVMDSHVIDGPDVLDELDAWIDRWGRPTAKVMLNGQGPFRFLVDTGSTTTVLSQRVATALSATTVGEATVNGTTGAALMPLAVIDTLETGVVAKRDIRVAILTDWGLGREDGILGADVFAGKRLTFDIGSRSVRVEPTRRTVHASLSNMRLRHGMLAEISGSIGAVSAKLMLDTGAQNCIVNPKLEAALMKAAPRMQRTENAKVVGVTGQVLVGNYLMLPKIDLKRVYVRDAGAIAADAPIFKLWGLENEPAMIVGVDVLSRLSNFSIDYGARVFDAQPLADLIARGGTLTG